MTLSIRPARPGEAGLVLSFVRELAEYEKLLHEVVASEDDIAESLFGESTLVRRPIWKPGDRVAAAQIGAPAA